MGIISRFSGILLMAVFLFSQPLYGQGGGFEAKEDLSGLPASAAFGLQLGSSFSVGGVAGGMFSHTVAPSLNWAVSEKLQIEVGSFFSHSRMHGLLHAHPSPGMGSFSPSAGSTMQRATLYTMGSYQVSPRLRITGGAWTERVRGEAPFYQMNPLAMEMNPQGVLMGFEYKITDNLRFGAEINMSNAPMGYYYTPGYPAPFFNHRSAPFRQQSVW